MSWLSRGWDVRTTPRSARGREHQTRRYGSRARCADLYALLGELLAQPAEDVVVRHAEIVDLAVLVAHVLLVQHDEPLVWRRRGSVQRLRIAQRDLLVARAVHQQERAAAGWAARRLEQRRRHSAVDGNGSE